MPLSIVAGWHFSHSWMSVPPSTLWTTTFSWKGFWCRLVSRVPLMRGFVHSFHLALNLSALVLLLHRGTSIWCGVPQGSILGPLLYILYTADVERIVESFGLAVQLYADDTQLYGDGSPIAAEELSARVLAAIDAVENWMSSNRLRLNATKTQFIWFGTRQQLAKRDLTSLASISPPLVSNDPVRNLGVLLDSELTMDAHIKQLCRSSFFQLRRLRVVRNCLSKRSLLTLTYAFVHNRLDYCNSILGSRLGGWIDYSPFSMPQRDWSSTFRSSRELRRPSAMSYTGSLLCFDPNTNFVSLCGTVLLVPPLCICGNYAFRLPPSQVVSISGLLPETTS